MQTRAIHAAIVRMMSDPALREAVYRDPAAALPELPEEVRSWLAAPDRRAWDVDPHRNGRLLSALLGEFGVSALALAALGWRAPRLHAFFGSPEFHRAIAGWSSLFFAFPAWLLASLSERGRASTGARAMVRLEAALAGVRRAEQLRPSVAAGCVAVAPHVAPLLLPGGALEVWQRHRAGAGNDTAAARRIANLLGASPAVSHARAFDGARLRPSDEEALLVTRGPSGPEIASVGDGLARVLLALPPDGAPAELFLAAAVAEGLERHEAEELLAELLGDGTLVSGAAARP
jgi:hypothetical protein